MQTFVAPWIAPFSRETTFNRAMSVDNDEKWILVEWGNSTHGIVHCRYLVNVDDKAAAELYAGCTVIVSKRGEQQIATFLARANDRSLLEQILKEAGSTEQPAEAGPSAPIAAEEEPGDFSGSASSWAPSENDRSDSTEGAEEEKEKKPKIKQNASDISLNEPQEEQPRLTRRRSTKKVLTPSNRVNAIIPNSMKKNKDKPKVKNYTNKKRKIQTVENETIEVEVPPKVKMEAANKPRTVNINVNVDDVIAMKKMFKELFKVMKSMRQFYRRNDTNEEHAKTNDNLALADPPEDMDQEMDDGEDLNRSDDNVLISNKYGNIENTQNEDEDKIYDVQIEEGENEYNAQKQDVYDIQNEAKNDEWVPIGSGKTLVHKDKYRKVKWTSYTMATRGLLLAVFPRRTLATHSLTGKRSPAFQNKPAKMCLDPKKVSDIIIEVVDRFKVRENLIRSIITTKCADECKMFRMRMEKKEKKQKYNTSTPKIEQMVANVENHEEIAKINK